MGVRGRLARMIDGGASARAAADALRAIEALTTELHALQHKVAALEAAQLDGFDSLRDAVAATTDDLVARVQAVDDRWASHE